MSHKYSMVHHLFREERPTKKRVSRMTLPEFRWWKYCHLRSAFGFMFDWSRMNNKEYMRAIRPSNIQKIRGSSRETR